MPYWIVAVILGIVEGITEFLPISSTGHLLIAEHWLPRQTDLFNIVIQCGAVIAVIPIVPQTVSSIHFSVAGKSNAGLYAQNLRGICHYRGDWFRARQERTEASRKN